MSKWIYVVKAGVSNLFLDVRRETYSEFSEALPRNHLLGYALGVVIGSMLCPWRG